MVGSPGRADNSVTGVASTGMTPRSPTANEREHERIDDSACENSKTRPKRDVRDADDKPSKRSKPDSAVQDLQIVEHAEQWAERDGDFVFDKTKIIIRQGNSVFMATTDKMESGLKGLDLEALERIRIPPEHFCPQFKQGLTRASVPILGDIYVKKPRLLSWDPEDSGGIAALVLQEAEVCETLKKHPHPNIAQYHGCLVDNGRITGLCFTKYTSDLQKTLSERKDITEKQKLAYSEAIRDGIRHLHQLGLAHNDINPSNIMMDGEKPVIIDFDSVRPIGEKLGDKAGTFEWELEGAESSEPENDLYGLNKIKEVTLQLTSQGVNTEE